MSVSSDLPSNTYALGDITSPSVSTTQSFIQKFFSNATENFHKKDMLSGDENVVVSFNRENPHWRFETSSSSILDDDEIEDLILVFPGKNGSPFKKVGNDYVPNYALEKILQQNPSAPVLAIDYSLMKNLQSVEEVGEYIASLISKEPRYRNVRNIHCAGYSLGGFLAAHTAAQLSHVKDPADASKKKYHCSLFASHTFDSFSDNLKALPDHWFSSGQPFWPRMFMAMLMGANPGLSFSDTTLSSGANLCAQRCSGWSLSASDALSESNIKLDLVKIVNAQSADPLVAQHLSLAQIARKKALSAQIEEHENPSYFLSPKNHQTDLDQMCEFLKEHISRNQTLEDLPSKTFP